MTLEAFECSTGRSIAAADAKAERKEDVLKALGGVTSIVRQKLGETPLQQFDLPIEQATTPSLEALQAYTLGRAERAKGKEIESIPFFRRALELDPRLRRRAHDAVDGLRRARGARAVRGARA